MYRTLDSSSSSSLCSSALSSREKTEAAAVNATAVLFCLATPASLAPLPSAAGAGARSENLMAAGGPRRALTRLEDGLDCEAAALPAVEANGRTSEAGVGEDEDDAGARLTAGVEVEEEAGVS